jgi:hypothetical protein
MAVRGLSALGGTGGVTLPSLGHLWARADVRVKVQDWPEPWGVSFRRVFTVKENRERGVGHRVSACVPN